MFGTLATRRTISHRNTTRSWSRRKRGRRLRQRSASMWMNWWGQSSRTSKRWVGLTLHPSTHPSSPRAPPFIYEWKRRWQWWLCYCVPCMKLKWFTMDKKRAHTHTHTHTHTLTHTHRVIMAMSTSLNSHTPAQAHIHNCINCHA